MNKSQLTALLASALLVTQANAGGISLYEIGSDDVGLAAAGYSARAQDPSTIMTNPAGMTRLPGNQLFVGLQLLYQDEEFSPSFISPFLGTNDGGNPIKAVPGGSLFYHYSVSDVLKAGIGLYGNFGSLLKYNGDWIGRYHVVKATLLGPAIQPTLAYKVADGLSIGGGPVVMFGIFDANTRINQSPLGIINFHDGGLKLSDHDWGIGANVGLLYEFNECARVGLTYTSPIKLDFDPTTKFSDLSLPLETLLANRELLDTTVGIGIHVPQSVMGSIFWQYLPRWAVLGSVGWQNWKKFGDVEVSVDSLNPVSFTVNKEFKDTWHGAVGMQHQINNRVLLNFGVGYDSKFQPSNNILLSTPVNSAWRFGVGTKFSTREDIDVGVNFEYIWGGNLDVNTHGVITGDVEGQFEQVQTFFFAVNFNWKCE